MKEICICYRLAGRDGAGLWFLDTQKTRSALVAQVADLNARHGPGTHWIEERTA